jgi:hypothetical protein
MAISTVTKNLNDGSITLADGTGTPVTLVVPVTIGDEAIQGLRAVSGITAKYNEVVAYEARGKLDGVRHTSRFYPSGSFTAHFREFTSASVGVLSDFLLKQNGYSANLSTLGSSVDVYCVKITITIEGTNHGDGTDGTAVLTNCHCTLDWSAGDPSTFTVNYVCYGTVTYTGTS